MHMVKEGHGPIKCIILHGRSVCVYVITFFITWPVYIMDIIIMYVIVFFVKKIVVFPTVKCHTIKFHF